MLQGQEEGNLYLLSWPDSYPLNPHLHRGWSHVVAPAAMNYRACTPPADNGWRCVCGRGRNRHNERKTDGGLRKCLLLLCHVGSLAPRPCALLRAWGFLHFHMWLGSSLSLEKVLLTWTGARHNLSCAYLAPVALSVRLVFFTKH